MKGRGDRERSDCGEVKEGEEEGRGGIDQMAVLVSSLPVCSG